MNFSARRTPPSSAVPFFRSASARAARSSLVSERYDDGHDHGDQIDHTPAARRVLAQEGAGEHADERHADEGDALGDKAVGRALFFRRGLHDVEHLHVVGREEHHGQHAENVLHHALAGHDDQHADAHADGVDHQKEAAAVFVRQRLVKRRDDQKQVRGDLPRRDGVDCAGVCRRIDAAGRDGKQIEQNVGLHGRVQVRGDLVHHINDRQHDHHKQQIVGKLRALRLAVEPGELLLLAPEELFFLIHRQALLSSSGTGNIIHPQRKKARSRSGQITRSGLL